MGITARVPMPAVRGTACARVYPAGAITCVRTVEGSGAMITQERKRSRRAALAGLPELRRRRTLPVRVCPAGQRRMYVIEPRHPNGFAPGSLLARRKQARLLLAMKERPTRRYRAHISAITGGRYAGCILLRVPAYDLDTVINIASAVCDVHGIPTRGPDRYALLAPPAS